VFAGLNSGCRSGDERTAQESQGSERVKHRTWFMEQYNVYHTRYNNEQCSENDTGCYWRILHKFHSDIISGCVEDQYNLPGVPDYYPAPAAAPARFSHTCSANVLLCRCIQSQTIIYRRQSTFGFTVAGR
jgi:hypothetical protein